jgi:hypothetical protein
MGTSTISWIVTVEVLGHHIELLNRQYVGTRPGPAQSLSGGASYNGLEGFSFIHFMASAGFTTYVEGKLTSNPCVPRPQVHMYLLLSAACGGQPALVKSLLATGASPHDLVEGFWDWDSSLRVKHTVWHLFCTRFACRVMDRHWIQLDMRDECEVIQHFIEAGADFNCFVLLGRKTNGYQFDEARPTHAISLRALIQQLHPPNVQVLLELMGEPKSARNSILSRIIGAS